MPMEILNVNWAEMGPHKYLVVVDRATVYLWYGEFSAMSTDNTVSFLLSIFSTFGTPLEIRSDSGPSFRATYETKMQELNIDTQFSSAYHPQGNGMAEEAVSKLKMCLSKNGPGVGSQHLQDLISSLNCATSSIKGAGSAAERMLGFTPRHDLPLLSRYFAPSKRHSMLEAIRVRRDNSSRKIRNTTLKEFSEGDRVRVYDIKSKSYSAFGTVIGCYPSSDGLVRTYSVLLDSHITRRCNSTWIRALRNGDEI